MRKRSRSNSETSDVASLTSELATLRAALESRRRRDGERERFDTVSSALVGELDPEAILDQAARWATAALGRPCTISPGPPADGAGVLLGTGAPEAWLHVGGASSGADDDAAVDEVSRRIGRALDAARIVDSRTQAMHTLERSLLPGALLPVPGIQMASRYVPARGTDVGGDFYDAIRTGDSVTLIVGDVQGKGIEAATLTALARHTLRTGALAGHPPDQMLGHVNRALLYGQQEQQAAGDHRLPRFVTAVAARLDPVADGNEGFALAIARAGQPPPLVVRSDGRFESFEPRGVLLGVSENPSYELATGHLAVGDTLVLYTDGVIEQRVGPDKAMSEQQLGMLVRNRRGVVDAEAIAQLIEDTVHLVAPEELRDDVAILVACVTGPGLSSPSAGDAAGQVGEGASAPRR